MGKKCWVGYIDSATGIIRGIECQHNEIESAKKRLKEEFDKACLKQSRIKYLQYRKEEHMKSIENAFIPELLEELEDLQVYLEEFTDKYQTQPYIFNTIMSCVDSIKKNSEGFAEEYNEVKKYDYVINTLRITEKEAKLSNERND